MGCSSFRPARLNQFVDRLRVPQWHSVEMSYVATVPQLRASMNLPDDAVVYPEGWQSWTPTDFYPITGSQRVPVDQRQFQLGYRADRPRPSGRPGEFVADGLLALIDPSADAIHVFASAEPARPVRFTANYRDGVCQVTSDGETLQANLSLTSFEGRPQPIQWRDALMAWATDRRWVQRLRPAPTVWCSWYQYFTTVTQSDVLENLDAMDELALPVDVVQIDDGYQREIGDWLDPSTEFPDLSELVRQIRGRGRRAGIWVAPWLVGERSRLAGEHPDWLVRTPAGDPVTAGFNWDQVLWVLDTGHPDARAYIHTVLSRFSELGVDYFKLDFLYAGALPGVRADGSDGVDSYRSLLGDIQQWFPRAYVVACGAPLLPSVGLVDAMRVSPDTAPHVQPSRGDFSAPGQASAMVTGRARRWQNGVWWTNDPDCLLARPGVEAREQWAAYLAEYPGLRGCSDRLRSLDSVGLRYTIRHLECATIQQ